MLDLAEKWKDTYKEYVEVNFLTKSGLRVGFYQKGTEQKALVSSGVIGGRYAGIKIEQLTSLKALVDEGAALLAGK